MENSVCYTTSKKSVPETLNDFRPISILPVFSKILERIIYDQLKQHVQTNALLPHTQSGFRPGHSTVTALLDINDEYLAAIDKSMVTTAVMLDLTKAFDCLNHEMLLAKLHFLGLASNTIAWFRSYLSHRMQKVKVHSLQMSDSLVVSSGVPQGSILGPILFSLYLSDLPGVIRHCKVHSYADDTQIYFSYPPTTVNESVAKINEDLSKISIWLNRQGLKLNCNKTVAITFRSARSAFEDNLVQLFIDGEHINTKNTVRNLGVIFDCHLTFKEHVTKVVQSSFAKLKTLYQFKNVLSTETKLRLSNSLILSKIEYANVVYGPCLTERETYRLQKVQNSCVRFSAGVHRREHITPYLKMNNLLNMHQRWELRLLCLVYCVLKNGAPAYLRNKLIFRNQHHNAQLRFVANTLHIPRHATTLFKSSFSYLAAVLYNKISETFMSLSYSSFKRKVQMSYFQN